MPRPIIGICADFIEVGSAAAPGKREEVRAPAAYVDAVALAGGTPVLLPPCEDLGLVGPMLSAVEGVLLTGGRDLDPARYGAEAHPSRVPLHGRREAFDLEAAARAEQMGLPVLAICLGIQVLNVARGGTLVQDVPTQRPAAGPHARTSEPGDPMHDVIVEAGTLLAFIVGEGRLLVNSAHHQAVDAVGRGLVVSARAADGLVEAVEDPTARFFLGVQWHPERILDRPEHRRLFEALVAAAKR